MSGRVFNFDDQKRIGDIGEADFLRVYESLAPKQSTTDFKVDFVLGDNRSVELKTDSYDMGRTPNFFMEQFTVSGNKTSLGGPWRSKEHKVDFFVYYFINNKVFFWFNPITLVDFLNKYIEENMLKPITIPNRDRRGGYYEAIGFKIPRESVVSVLLKKHDKAVPRN